MAPQKHTYSIILAAVPRLRADQRWGPRLSNKWLPAETWVKAIEQARLINVDLHIDAGKFNKAMACEICTWRIYKYYYATESGKHVPYPVPLDAKWKEKADEAGAQALIIPVTRSRPPPPQAEGGAPDTDSTTETHTPETDTQLPARKRARISAASVLNESYWEQTEARKLFCPRDDDNTVRETLMRRIDQLRVVNSSNEGWRKVIIGHDCDNDCSMNDIFEIRQRYLFLRQAYVIALETMTSGTPWRECCSEACERLNAMGITLATNPRVVEQYNRLFRSNEMFLHPNASVRLGKKPAPPLLSAFPELKEKISSFCVFFPRSSDS